MTLRLARFGRIKLWMVLLPACSVDTFGWADTLPVATTSATAITETTGITAPSSDGTTALPTTGGLTSGTSTSTDTSSGDGTSTSSAGTTSEPGPVCPEGAGMVARNRGFTNLGSETIAALALVRDFDNPREVAATRLLAAGQVFACGEGAMVNLGSGVNVLEGWRSLLVAYDHDLNHVATRVIGNEYVFTGDIGVDGSGNIYILGQFGSAVDIPLTLFVEAGGIKQVASKSPGELPPASTWIAVYSPDGTLKWDAALSALNSSITPKSIDVSGDGDFRVVGRFIGASTFDGFKDTKNCNGLSGSESDSYVAAFPKSGPALGDFGAPSIWCTLAADEVGSAVYLNDSVRLADGRTVVVGSFVGGAKLSAGLTVSSNNKSGDAIYIVYDENGSVEWRDTRGGVGEEIASAVSAGLNGDVIIAGGDGVSASPGVTGKFTLAYVQTLNLATVPPTYGPEAKIAPPADPAGIRSRFTSVAIDACGGVVVVGYGSGPIHWSGDVDDQVAGDVAETNVDIWVARLDSKMSPVWGKTLATEGPLDAAGPIVMGAEGDIFVGGGYSGALNVPPDISWPSPTLAPTCPQSLNNADAFLVRLSP